jgi:NAD(P)H-flavin reductase
MTVVVPEHLAPRTTVRRLATGSNPYAPAPARIMRVQELTSDIRLYDLRFTDSALADRFVFRPGQFVELSILGVGEGPFSLPSSPTRRGYFRLGIRRAGTLTDYLFDHVREGDTVGIRGPLGNGFPVELFEGQNVLLVAGGLGMVPLRGLLHYLIDQRDHFGRVLLLYGTRSPDQVLFRDELESLARRGDAEILLSVDGTQGKPWGGRVGVVTGCSTRAVRRLNHLRPPEPPVTASSCSRSWSRGWTSPHLPRAPMECGSASGHCAVGYTFTCLHGPVFSAGMPSTCPS